MRMKSVYTSRDIYLVPLEDLNIMPGWNARRTTAIDYEQSILAMMESIRVHGIKEIITTRQKDEKLWVVDGHRRIVAAKRCEEAGISVKGGLREIRCVPENPKASESDLLLDQYVYNEHQRLTLLDNADLCHRFKDDFGWTVSKIAHEINLTTVHVENLLLLFAVPEDVKEMIDLKLITASTVIKAIRKHGLDEAVELTRTSTAQAKSEGRTKVTPKFLAQVAQSQEPGIAETAPLASPNQEAPANSGSPDEGLEDPEDFDGLEDLDGPDVQPESAMSAPLEPATATPPTQELAPAPTQVEAPPVASTTPPTQVAQAEEAEPSMPAPPEPTQVRQPAQEPASSPTRAEAPLAAPTEPETEPKDAPKDEEEAPDPVKPSLRRIAPLPGPTPATAPAPKGLRVDYDVVGPQLRSQMDAILKAYASGADIEPPLLAAKDFYDTAFPTA